MSYWSALGLPGSPLSDAVEYLAQWVQWAVYGVGQGVSETNFSEVPFWMWAVSPAYVLATTPTNEAAIRYNLTQFWDLKGSALQAATSEDERRQIYRLDMLAHGVLNAVDEGLLVSKSPSYWRFWSAFMVGGTAPRNTEGLEAEAREAAQAAATAARQAGLSDLGTYFDRESTSGVDQVQAAANSYWSQEGVLNVSGVPLWAWLALLGAGLLLWRRL